MSQQTLYTETAISLVEALQSEQLDAEYWDYYRASLERMGGTFSHHIESILADEELSGDERRQLLELVARKHRCGEEGFDFLQDAQRALDFQVEMVQELFHWAFSKNQVFSAQWELTREGVGDFPCDFVMPSHSVAIAYTKRGEACFRYEGGEYRSQGPEVIMFGRQKHFVLELAEGCDRCDLYITIFVPKPTWDESWYFAHASEPVVIDFADQPAAPFLDTLFHQIIEVTHSDLNLKDELHFNLVEQLLLLTRGVASDQAETQVDPRVERACHYIQTHYAEKLTVGQIADAVGVATSTLTALFRSELGSNIVKWRDQYRMKLARERLIHSEQPVKSIAIEVGYDDPLVFSRRFKQVTGWSPSQIRKQAQC